MIEPDRQAMPPLSPEISGIVKRASERSAAVVREEMKEGLNSLATIATIAPWLGLFGTLVGISSSFMGCNGEESACMAAMFERLSGSFWPTALGLLVGLTSLWFYKYLTGRLEGLEREMESAALELVNQLARYRGRWKFGATMEGVSGRPMFGAQSLAELRQDQRFWCRSMFLTGAALLVAWCVEVVRYFEDYSLPLYSATWMACWYVLIAFCASCFPAHVLWVRGLRRRRGGLAVLAAAFCLCWCVVDLVLRGFEPAPGL